MSAPAPLSWAQIAPQSAAIGQQYGGWVSSVMHPLHLQPMQQNLHQPMQPQLYSVLPSAFGGQPYLPCPPRNQRSMSSTALGSIILAGPQELSYQRQGSSLSDADTEHGQPLQHATLDLSSGEPVHEQGHLPIPTVLRPRLSATPQSQAQKRPSSSLEQAAGSVQVSWAPYSHTDGFSILQPASQVQLPSCPSTTTWAPPATSGPHASVTPYNQHMHANMQCELLPNGGVLYTPLPAQATNPLQPAVASCLPLQPTSAPTYSAQPPTYCAQPPIYSPGSFAPMAWGPYAPHGPGQVYQTVAIHPPEADSSAHYVHRSGMAEEDMFLTRALKRPRLVWTQQLHHRFEKALEKIGEAHAVPKAIMQEMRVEGLTRENVASHLQKYRLARMRGIPMVVNFEVEQHAL